MTSVGEGTIYNKSARTSSSGLTVYRYRAVRVRLKGCKVQDAFVEDEFVLFGTWSHFETFGGRISGEEITVDHVEFSSIFLNYESNFIWPDAQFRYGKKFPINALSNARDYHAKNRREDGERQEEMIRARISSKICTLKTRGWRSEEGPKFAPFKDLKRDCGKLLNAQG